MAIPNQTRQPLSLNSDYQNNGHSLLGKSLFETDQTMYAMHFYLVGMK
jgi:hypothetical protein